MQQYITIKDVAKKLGVAPSTVSRAFNNASDISEKTRERVLQVAKEMGYRPNPVAQHLHLRKTFQVGVVIPEFINDFFPRIIMGMQEVLQEAGYQLLIMQSNEHHETELENINRLEQNMVDGLMVSLSSETVNIERYNQLYHQGMPMVFFNRVNEYVHAPKVVFNDFKWSYFATEHLIQQGCRNIYHLAGYKHLSLSRERIRGFEKGLNKFHLDYDDSHIVETGFLMEEGKEKMAQLLAAGARPDGIFATNDPTALGAMRALQQAGFRIPEDVKVAGFSEARFSELVQPSLTTVCQPTCEIGRASAKLLLAQINGEPFDQPTIVLDGKLIKRDSTKVGMG